MQEHHLEALPGLTVYPSSVVELAGTTCFLARREGDGRPGRAKLLGVVGDAAGFAGKKEGPALLCELTPVNAAALRARLPWLRPVPLGLRTSAGMGDRLGLATAGHVRAARRFGSIAPIFAQQSVRENARTGRTPQQVLDEAMWGLFQQGWREPWGADADHLKTPADVDEFLAAGYTFYTIDPGDHVDNAAHTASSAELEARLDGLPWASLGDTIQGLEGRYLGRSFNVGGVILSLDREALWRAAAKYGSAIAHTVRMYRHLAARTDAFEFEMSVDETETPTSAEEHLFIACELERLGVRWASLAPRFVGRFEKGVDYIGDLAVFSAELARHAAIARALGPYKLSIHSGSDKFSIYPLVAEHTRGLVHLKTAGTSYLEALRAMAQEDPPFFREILAFSIDCYPRDRSSYHVSAQLTNVPRPGDLDDAALPGLLDQFDARQVLHVTFGSVLDRFGARLREMLLEHEDIYHDMLETHFVRHLEPFARVEAD